MKPVNIYLTILALSSAATLAGGFKAKVGYGFKIGKEYFFDLPRTKEKAISMGWQQTERPTSPLPSLQMYCPGPLTLCVMYDNVTNYVAGLQVALPQTNFTGAIFNWSIQGFIPWTPPTVTGRKPETYMTKQMYFVSEKTLSKSEGERQQIAKKDNILQEDVVWLTGFHKKLMPVSTNADGIIKDGFTEQNCFPFMGTHYFYNMTTETECKDGTLLNWFLLVDQHGDLIGVAFTVIGVVPQKKGETYYFERPTKEFTLHIIKHCPQCLTDLLEDPTSTTVHIYFIKRPWTLLCPITIW